MNISQKTSDIKDGWRYHISDCGNIDRRYKGEYLCCTLIILTFNTSNHGLINYNDTKL